MAMVHAFDLKYKQRMAELMPYGIYTIPECSMVGETEDSAQRKGIAYVVGRARYRHNARGGIIGDDAGFLKLIYRADDMQLIGAHMIGEQAIELINIGLLSMQAKADFQAFIDACFNSRASPTCTSTRSTTPWSAGGRAACKGGPRSSNRCAPHLRATATGASSERSRRISDRTSWASHGRPRSPLGSCCWSAAASGSRAVIASCSRGGHCAQMWAGQHAAPAAGQRSLSFTSD
jgi:hypothetical protein